MRSAWEVILFIEELKAEILADMEKALLGVVFKKMLPLGIFYLVWDIFYSLFLALSKVSSLGPLWGCCFSCLVL